MLFSFRNVLILRLGPAAFDRCRSPFVMEMLPITDKRSECQKEGFYFSNTPVLYVNYIRGVGRWPVEARIIMADLIGLQWQLGDC